MSDDAKTWKEQGWCVIVCPNPHCHRVIARQVNVELAKGCLEFMCRACRRRAVMGQPDPVDPPRLQVIVLSNIYAYRVYRDAAERRCEALRRRIG